MIAGKRQWESDVNFGCVAKCVEGDYWFLESTIASYPLKNPLVLILYFIAFEQREHSLANDGRDYS